MNADHVRALDRRLRLISRIAIVAMAVVVFYFSSRATWDPRQQINDGGWSAGFFMAQANAILHARLNVEDHDIHAECFRRETLCYGYFGVTPSMLRIPVLGILRWLRSALTPVYLALALLIAYGTALRLLRRSLITSAHAASAPSLVTMYTILGTIALGPGSTLLFDTRPAVFEEAIAWSLAFTLLTFDHVWAWWVGVRKSLVPAVLFGMAAANARPTAALACGVLGLVVIAIAYQSHRLRRQVLTAALCLSLLPGLTAGAVFWLKLRTPLPSPLMNEQIQQAPFWQEILRINGQTTMSLMFTPTELVAYFRPDTVVRRPDWPWFDFRFPQYQQILWVPPLPFNGAYQERFTSLTTTMPVPWIINVIAILWLAATARVWATAHAVKLTPAETVALTRTEWTFAAGLLASAAAMFVLVITTVGITNRYLSDFYVTSVVGFALGHRALLPFLARRPAVAWLAGLGSFALVSWSVVVVLSLTTLLVFY